MGFKASDLSTISSTGPTATSPTAKDLVIKSFMITRSDTTATVKAVLPADSTIIDVKIWSAGAANAGTLAALNVGFPGSPTYILNYIDCKTAGGRLNTNTVANMYNVENSPLSGDIQLTGQYVETGTPSTQGGPFYVTVEYVR